jgi:hypothetical protein
VITLLVPFNSGHMYHVKLVGVCHPMGIIFLSRVYINFRAILSRSEHRLLSKSESLSRSRTISLYDCDSAQNKMAFHLQGRTVDTAR